MRPRTPINHHHYDRRLRVVGGFFFLLAAWIIVRLFILQVLNHDYYALLALNTHEIYQKIYPHRGAIYWQDTRDHSLAPAIINRQYYLVYAVPREIPPGDVPAIAKRLAELFEITDLAKQAELQTRLSRSDSWYQPLLKKVLPEVAGRITAEKLPGIYLKPEEYRFYPEEQLGGPVLGFGTFTEEGTLKGQYGLEAYWNEPLAGKGGLRSGERGAKGSWIALAGGQVIPAEDGVDLVLTVDRTLQYKACERLRAGFSEHRAKSAALVMLNPTTGAVLAMCSLPDFDPNNYAATEDLAAFNNTAIFTAYEPGSVFKPITMAAALDQNLVTPATRYTDPCSRVINGFVIHNAENKCYQERTMTEVLQYSINTGLVWVQEKLGRERFRDYVKKFGFGEQSGIELPTEASGNISSLDKLSPIYGAVGSFGQGLTVTPIQIAAAYAAIGNGGRLSKPYIVQEVRYPDGRRIITESKVVEQALSPHSAKLLTGMLTAVVSKYRRVARTLSPYYVAGKTGTAQVAGKGGYLDATNQTFAGFAPAEDPKIVLVVKYENPASPWAELTAGPVFADVMKFALEYYQIPATH